MPTKTFLPPKQITIVGAGLVGSLLAITCARRGFQVQVFERRPDPRTKRHSSALGEGRSINLAISKRGINALERVDIHLPVLTEAIPMPGRMMHSPSGDLTFQAYGQTPKDCINSISRGWLNNYLLDVAEKTPGVEIHFNQNIQSVDLEKKSFNLVESDTQKERKIFYDVLIGTDGSASAVRKSMQKKLGLAFTEEELSHTYKEFLMPASESGKHKIEKNALHIWPRGSQMMIALPNKDGSYTCTLFFEKELKTPEEVQEVFALYYKDFCELVPNYIEQYFSHPTGKMVTLKGDQWMFKDSVLLMGDAAHAIVPFFGQGMNCGFEDVVVFDELMSECSSWQELFTEFFTQRKTNADAIADMAVENLTEMSTKTADPYFLYQKKIEKHLQDEFPKDYRSRYTLVSFTLTPYRLAYEAGLIQGQILDEITRLHYPNTDFSLGPWREVIRDRLGPVMQKINNYLVEES